MRAFGSWRFPAAVILMFLVWELNSRRFTLYEDVLYLYIHVWGRSITPLLAMAITSTGYVASFCEDVENHLLRYTILRTGVFRYVLSKILVCFLISFTIIASGTVLFIGWRCLSLPLVAENSMTIQNFKDINCFGGLLTSRPVLFIGIQMIFHEFYCGSMSVLALAFSVFIRNSYGVYVIPFLLNYCFFYLFLGLSSEYPMLCIERIYDSSTSTYTGSPAVFIGYGSSVTVVFVLLGYGILYKKLKGEFQ